LKALFSLKVVRYIYKRPRSNLIVGLATDLEEFGK
jgi:hypothetical protein